MVKPRVIDKSELFRDLDYWLSVLKKAIFVYPSDLMYRLGCNALDKELISRVRVLKQSSTQPFTVIAPSKHWIEQNFVVTSIAKRWLEKLPGPYTLVLKKKQHSRLAVNLNPGNDVVHVRIPNHWFSSIVEKLGVPIVATSPNIAAGDLLLSINHLDEDLKQSIDLIISDTVLNGLDKGLDQARVLKTIDLTQVQV